MYCKTRHLAETYFKEFLLKIAINCVRRRSLQLIISNNLFLCFGNFRFSWTLNFLVFRLFKSRTTSNEIKGIP